MSRASLQCLPLLVLLVLCCPSLTAQQFTGTVEISNPGKGLGIFGLPVGSQISGEFSVSPSNLTNFVSVPLFPTGTSNYWSGVIGNADSFSIGDFTIIGLNELNLATSSRDITYGMTSAPEGGRADLYFGCGPSGGGLYDVTLGALPVTDCEGSIYVNYAATGDSDSYFLLIYFNTVPGSAGPIAPQLVVSPPTFNYATGLYTSPLTVTMQDTTDGATIYYTTDGFYPTVNSKVYTGPISVTSSTTLQAIAMLNVYTRSAPVSARYILSTSTPSLSPAPGIFGAAQSVTITDSTPGSTIYYTTDGSFPGSYSKIYGGPITVTSTETIQAIAEAPGYTDGAVALATYTIAKPPIVVQLLDPVDSGYVISYSGGTMINTDTDLLASGGTTVQGAAADGVSQVLIRIPASQVGQQFNLTLVNELGVTDTVTADGGLLQLGGGGGGTFSPPVAAVTPKRATVPTASSATLSVTAVSTTQGPMAFAVYASPIDFARNSMDYIQIARSLALQVTSTGYVASSPAMSLARPPVVLVHGLWADPQSWKTFTGLVNDPLQRFAIYKANYDIQVSNVESITPTDLDFEPDLTTISSNSLGFIFNAAIVETQIQQIVNNYAQSLHVSSVQADVVAHSMGGVVTRAIGLIGPDQTAGTGLVHKLITIGTPHLGSPLATNLLSGGSECSREILSSQQDPSYSFVSIRSPNGQASFVNGAVYDLAGVGDGTGLSPILEQLRGVPLPFPISYIGGTSSAVNWQDLGGPNISELIQLYCSATGPDQIANALTSSNWSTLFSNVPNDSVVTLNSQFNGITPSPTAVFPAVIHSLGLEDLDFDPPTELDHSSGIDSLVINLLNALTNGNSFQARGQRQ